MKTAKEILYAKAASNNDGFLSGQMRWILEAMEEYHDQFKNEKDNVEFLETSKNKPDDQPK